MNKPYIIAEAEINHNGDINIAKEMITVAKECGAHCVKFQFVIADELADKSSEYYELFAKVELSLEEFKILKNYAEKEVGIDFMITATSPKSFEYIKELGATKIKIGSANINNLLLLRAIASCEYHIEIFLSTGMSNLADLENALKNLKYSENAKNFTLFHCTSNYPAQSEDLNLNAIATLKNLYPNCPIGYSDHSEGNLAASLSSALGATLFEKHFTLDNTMEGPDHSFSANPQSLKEYIDTINESFTALGSHMKKPAKTEIQMRKNARRFLIAKEDISEGTQLNESYFSTKRVGNPDAAIRVDEIDTITKFHAKKAYKSGDIFYWSDFA